MSFLFTATDPAGKIHRSYDQDAFEALLRDLRAEFPDGSITVRADVNLDTPTMQSQGGAA